MNARFSWGRLLAIFIKEFQQMLRDRLTFAMAVGTFITVSVIAAIAVYSKQLAARLVRGNSRLLDWFGIGLRFAGGGAIAFLGTILFLGSLGTTNAMM